jgi:undecaprenyl pyrophosphate phosphatase UppP
MSIWARIIVTVILMVVISFLAGALWNSIFQHPIPAYAAGLIGGLVAVPVWEVLKKFKPKAPQ